MVVLGKDHRNPHCRVYVAFRFIASSGRAQTEPQTFNILDSKAYRPFISHSAPTIFDASDFS